MAVVEKIYFPVVGQNLSVKVPRGCLKSVEHKLVCRPKIIRPKIVRSKIIRPKISRPKISRPKISRPNVCFPYVENSLSNSFWSPLKLTYPSVEIDGDGKLPERKKNQVRISTSYLVLLVSVVLLSLSSSSSSTSVLSKKKSKEDICWKPWANKNYDPK